jgi:outer membrane protein
MKKLILLTLVLFTYSASSFAGTSYFIDFYKVLNNSKAGSQVQIKLKEKFISETKKYKNLENDIRKEESEIISQKTALSTEEYQKKVEALRKKVADLQKNKQKSSVNIKKSRNDARTTLLKEVNPIIKKYMADNKIELVIEKKSVILGNSNLEITNQIIAILDKELPSLKLN